MNLSGGRWFRLRRMASSPARLSEVLVLGLLVLGPIPALLFSLLAERTLPRAALPFVAGCGIAAAFLIAYWRRADSMEDRASAAWSRPRLVLVGLAGFAMVGAFTIAVKRDTDRATVEFYLHPQTVSAVASRIPSDHTILIVDRHGDQRGLTVVAGSTDGTFNIPLSEHETLSEVRIPVPPQALTTIELRVAGQENETLRRLWLSAP